MPQLSAKHHSHKSRSTKFSFNLNLGALLTPPVCQPTSTYVERTTIVQPTPVVQTVIQEPVYQTVYTPPVYQTQTTYQSYYPQQVIVERPTIVERSVIVERPYMRQVYVQPQASYYSSWGMGIGYHN